jgi:hypothetical protein
LAAILTDAAVAAAWRATLDSASRITASICSATEAGTVELDGVQHRCQPPLQLALEHTFCISA